mmetsp:Transcript_7832/g.18045  ORF Transcript_7832/g.18045 Transcript_7832/m.18045 type:complete len:245 (-) Transcript_7832:121-855(-)
MGLCPPDPLSLLRIAFLFASLSLRTATRRKLKVSEPCMQALQTRAIEPEPGLQSSFRRYFWPMEHAEHTTRPHCLQWWRRETGAPSAGGTAKNDVTKHVSQASMLHVSVSESGCHSRRGHRLSWMPGDSMVTASAPTPGSRSAGGRREALSHGRGVAWELSEFSSVDAVLSGAADKSSVALEGARIGAGCWVQVLAALLDDRLEHGEESQSGEPGPVRSQGAPAASDFGCSCLATASATAPLMR